MGLEAVELIIAVEETFGITLEDDALSLTMTVGDLYELILKNLDDTKTKTCVSGMIFNKLRRTLIDDFGIERGRIRPDTPLKDLFQGIPTAKFAELNAKKTGLNIPFWLPYRVKTILSTAVITLILLTFSTLLYITAATFWGMILPSIIVILTFLALYLAITSKQDHIRVERDSVRDLIKQIAITNFGLSEGVIYKPTNKEKVWHKLQDLIMDVGYGVKREEITPTAKFGDDLGFG